MSPTWRWRRCPVCLTVERASAFEPARPYQGWGEGYMRRRCPSCGWIGATHEFRVIRERHAATKVGQL
jgi:hypothetical protein